LLYGVIATFRHHNVQDLFAAFARGLGLARLYAMMAALAGGGS
jgi:hypothetical protein